MTSRTEAMNLMRERSGHEVFEHTAWGVIDITLLREFIRERPELFPLVTVPLGEEEIRQLLELREVDEPHAMQLPLETRDEPGIICFDESEANGKVHAPIDGHHRMLRRFKDGLRSMTFYVVALRTAQCFTPTGTYQDLPWGEKELADGKLVPKTKEGT